MNTRRWLATGLLVVLALACSALAVKKDALIFSHKLHVTDNEVACADCHKGIGDADAVDAIAMPGHDTCWGCHEDGEETCTKCHADPDNVVAKPRAHTPGLTFSHSLHVEATEGDCQACHKGMDAGVFNHDGDFLGRHGLLARSEAVVCQHCHTEDSCQRCHDQLQPTRASVRDRMDVSSRFVHRGDYLSSHAIEAGLDGDGEHERAEPHRSQREPQDPSPAHQTSLARPRRGIPATAVALPKNGGKGNQKARPNRQGRASKARDVRGLRGLAQWHMRQGMSVRRSRLLSISRPGCGLPPGPPGR